MVAAAPRDQVDSSCLLFELFGHSFAFGDLSLNDFGCEIRVGFILKVPEPPSSSEKCKLKVSLASSN